MFGRFGVTELLLILAIVLLLFGAARLPGLARSLGRSVKEFRAGVRDEPGKDNDAEGRREA